jgi:hypothetical protein
MNLGGYSNGPLQLTFSVGPPHNPHPTEMRKEILCTVCREKAYTCVKVGKIVQVDPMVIHQKHLLTLAVCMIMRLVDLHHVKVGVVGKNQWMRIQGVGAITRHVILD